MENVLFLCPTSREFRDLPAIAEQLGVNLIFDEFGGDYFDDLLVEHPQPTAALQVMDLIEETLEKHSFARLSGVTSAVGYPGYSAAAIMADRLGLPGPSPYALLLCEHKYYSRLKQKELLSEAVPDFALIDPKTGDGVENVARLPVFLKPVKSCMSKNAHRVESRRELSELVRQTLLPEEFIKPFNDMWAAHTVGFLSASYLLAERAIDGHQVSLEGYVSGGEVHVMGIIDAVMFPGTFSFKRFVYPSKLDAEVRQRMCAIAEQFITGIAYGDGMFNMELIYDERRDEIYIIEVNPKIASQFPDLFEKVDGFSSYSVLLEMALGREPTVSRGNGKHRLAASCVLRTFEDKRVIRAPQQNQIDEIYRRFPDARVQIYGHEGKLLSEQVQDSQSFRYGLVHLGADSEQQLDERFSLCERILDFELAPA